MPKLLIWSHCFLWMFMMMAKILQYACSYFPSIMATISKIQLNIQGLSEMAKESFKQSPEKDIPKRRSKGKSKKRKMKDNVKECLYNAVQYNERDSQEDSYNTKEVPSNGLSDANSIVRKSRPPERVKWISQNHNAMILAAAMIYLGQFSGASAKSLPYSSLEVGVGQNASMEIPQNIAGNASFYIRYTPDNNSSDYLTLCKYSDGTLTTSDSNNSYLQGISCLRNGVFIASARPHQAGTYRIILGCAEPECPIILIFNLFVTDAGGGGGGGGKSNSGTIISVVITLFALVPIVILAAKFIIRYLHKRKQHSFPGNKNSNSSSAADNKSCCRMMREIKASNAEEESAKFC